VQRTGEMLAVMSSPFCTLAASKWRAPNREFHEAFQADLGGPVLIAKIIRLVQTPNQHEHPACPAPDPRGVSRSSRTLEAGCDGRDCIN
jgi:hypothetical protein